MTEPSENGDYQPVRDKQVNSSQSTVSDDIIGTKPTWTLPPKALPARGLPNFSRSIFFASLITAHSLVALLVLLTRIWSLLPNKYIERGPDRESMLPFSDWVYKPWANTISCDLVSANASAFEDAFTIDLRSHLHLSFAKAKLIDVVWDLVIGQGGRLLLAWISYGVFMDGLTRLMETSTVSYQLYASIVFETSSLASTWCSLKAVFIGHDWRGRAFLAWFGLATLCTLAYPTLMSAATGYLKPSDIRYRVLNDTLISPDSSDLNYCIQIHNAPAIGLDDGYIVPGPSNKDLFEVYNDERSSENLMTTYAFYDLLSSLKEGTGKSFIDIFSLVNSKI